MSIEQRLTENFIKIAEYHKTEPGIYYGCQEMASISGDHLRELRRENGKYMNGNKGDDFISMIRDHVTGLDLIADLHFMWLLTMEAALMNSLLLHASAAMSENDLEFMCSNFERETEKQSQWLLYRLNMAAHKETVDA